MRIINGMKIAGRDDLSRWFDEGVARGATHMLVLYDYWHRREYPRYVPPSEDVLEVFRLYSRGLTVSVDRVIEVYDLSLEKQDQLNEYRALHLPEASPPQVRAPRVAYSVSTEATKQQDSAKNWTLST